MNINRILAAAQHMIDSGHYASQHVRIIADRLDTKWKEFTASLEERTAVLALSVLFHHKAEQVRECFLLQFVLKWERGEKNESSR